MTDKVTITSVGIKDEYLAKMDEIKAKFGLAKKFIINEAIKEYLENHNFDELEI